MAIEFLSLDLGCGDFILTNSIAFFYSLGLTSIVTLHTYDASVMCFDGQDILVADTDLKENECREITIQYSFDVQSGNCQLIYISPELEEKVLAESGNGSVTVQLQAGANYIGISGTDYSGSIQIAIE